MDGCWLLPTVNLIEESTNEVLAFKHVAQSLWGRALQSLQGDAQVNSTIEGVRTMTISQFAIHNKIAELFSQLTLDFKVESVKVLSGSINSSGGKLLPLLSTPSPVSTHGLGPVSDKYMSHMKKVGKPLSAPMMADALGVPVSQVYNIFNQLCAKNLIRRSSRGHYVPV